MMMMSCVSAQSCLVRGAAGRALLAGSAALHADERTAEPHWRQNVFPTPRPSATASSWAPAGRNQTTLCDQVGCQTKPKSAQTFVYKGCFSVSSAL